MHDVRQGGLMVRILRSGSEPWPGSLCGALQQDTTLTVPFSTLGYEATLTQCCRSLKTTFLI